MKHGGCGCVGARTGVGLVGWLNKIAWRWRLIILSWKMGVPLRPLKIETPEPSLTITQLVWLVKGESKKWKKTTPW